jgi:hypothetical protein
MVPTATRWLDGGMVPNWWRVAVVSGYVGLLVVAMVTNQPWWLRAALLVATVMSAGAAGRGQSLQRKSRLASSVATAPQATSTSHSPIRA